MHNNYVQAWRIDGHQNNRLGMYVGANDFCNRTISTLIDSNRKCTSAAACYSLSMYVEMKRVRQMYIDSFFSKKRAVERDSK